MDDIKYQNHVLKQEEDFEALCSRCGACCGALDDPCSNLVKGEGGQYFCKDYSDRLGPQKTVLGLSFTCVPIQSHIEQGTLRAGCSYAKSRNFPIELDKY